MRVASAAVVHTCSQVDEVDFKAVQAQRLSKRRAPGAPGGPSGGLEGEGGSGGNFSDEEKIELGVLGLKNRGFIKPSQL